MSRSADPWTLPPGVVRPLQAGPHLRVALPKAETGPDPVRRVRRIGLLGGSFNPAHEGHLHVSQEALKRLRLDGVWWLVSPQNPLKTRVGMASFADRLAGARDLLRGHPRIAASGIEARLGTRYTVDTLDRLVTRTGCRFVWLIGADNLAQLPRWRRWRKLFAECAIAVFDREPYSYTALRGRAAVAFAEARVDGDDAADLADRPLPAWTFLRVARHPASSTAIRAAKAASETRAAGAAGGTTAMEQAP